MVCDTRPFARGTDHIVALLTMCLSMFSQSGDTMVKQQVVHPPSQARTPFIGRITQLLQYSTCVSFIPGGNALACKSRKGHGVTMAQRAAVSERDLRDVY
jgi:hypothetical protein